MSPESRSILSGARRSRRTSAESSADNSNDAEGRNAWGAAESPSDEGVDAELMEEGESDEVDDAVGVESTGLAGDFRTSRNSRRVESWSRSREGAMKHSSRVCSGCDTRCTYVDGNACRIAMTCDALNLVGEMGEKSYP